MYHIEDKLRKQTWAGELFKTKRKKDSIDISCYSDNVEFILANDLFVAVLEKNKEIENEIKPMGIKDTPTWLQIKKDLEARAFRELVKECEKVKE